MTVHSYAEACTYLGAKTDRPAGNNTRLQRRAPGEVAVVLHGSAVVVYHQDSVTLDSCGYHTSTTKERLNSFGPEGWNVYQDRGAWYLRNWRTNAVFPFADGITIAGSGKVTGAGAEGEVTEKRRTARRIAAYVKAYMAALVEGKVPAPGAGDCLHCGMRDQDSGKSLGEAVKSTDHLDLHIEESYFVPSLLLRAIEVYPVSIAARGRLGELWGINPAPALATVRAMGSGSDFLNSILIEQGGSSLKRFMRAQYGIAS